MSSFLQLFVASNVFIAIPLMFGYKLFGFISSKKSHKSRSILNLLKIIKKFHALLSTKLLINVKMPTNAVCILTLMNRISTSFEN